MKRDTRIILGFCLLFFLFAGILFVRQQRESAVLTEEAFLTQEEGENLASQNREEQKTGQKQNEEVSSDGQGEKECAVYISGAVKHAGVYRYMGTARVCDAVEYAGGFLKNADQSSINLARVLEDGEQIHVLTKAQAKKKEVVSGQVPGGQSEFVNINKATLEELMTLPGIGQAKAQLILDYRTEHGDFDAKEDLMKISGIKDGVYNKIKDLITIT